MCAKNKSHQAKWNETVSLFGAIKTTEQLTPQILNVVAAYWSFFSLWYLFLNRAVWIISGRLAVLTIGCIESRNIRVIITRQDHHNSLRKYAKSSSPFHVFISTKWHYCNTAHDLESRKLCFMCLFFILHYFIGEAVRAPSVHHNFKWSDFKEENTQPSFSLMSLSYNIILSLWFKKTKLHFVITNPFYVHTRGFICVLHVLFCVTHNASSGFLFSYICSEI